MFVNCRYTIFLTVALSAVFIELSASVQAQHDYLNIVRRYADTMIEYGRDDYGLETTPLFAVCLDRSTLCIHEGEALKAVLLIKRSDWGIRSHDRMVQGANPMQDQNLYRLLYALSELTGEEQYMNAADDALRYFFTHCQSETTGLFAWGEHIGWDFTTDFVIDKPSGFLHEFARPWMLWDRSFLIAEKACLSFAMGIWENQIADKETAHYSRHAHFDKHSPGKGSEYPRHGGFYIATWAEAYRRTKDPLFTKAIETLVNAYQIRRHYKTDALLAETQSPDLMWSQSCVSLAVDLWDSRKGMPEDLSSSIHGPPKGQPVPKVMSTPIPSLRASSTVCISKSIHSSERKFT